MTGYLGLGSNVGDRRANLQAAKRPNLQHAPALPRKEVEEWLRIFAEREPGEDD